MISKYLTRTTKQLIFLCFCTFMFGTIKLHAQVGSEVKGLIKDEAGQGMPGVNVIEKGTMNGTTSDLDGKYSIKLTTVNAVLEISFLGYTTQNISVGNKTSLDISLQAESTSLDQVVVLGYANARKQDLSVAVSTMKIDESSVGRPSSISTFLQGQIPGVSVTKNGDPRSGGDLSIRGKGNKNGDAILFVVDGVPGAPYNPADIETITVLKDAASAAIYGAHAGSGGVIVITTKQAKVKCSCQCLVGSTRSMAFTKGIDC